MVDTRTSGVRFRVRLQPRASRNEIVGLVDGALRVRLHAPRVDGAANDALVAFLADRDSVFDAFVTRVGSGQFANLTNGRLPQLYNEDVRNIGFTADTSHLWVRVADIASPLSISSSV